jgi:Cof subfamily protein (haloacid dehalogenase superfamily)
MRTKFKLIAADLDGTILDDNYTVMPELLSYINRAREKGVDLVVATGRLYPSAMPFVTDLGVTLPVIASNGAVVKNPLTGELIYHFPLAKELAIEALKLTEGDTVQRFVNIDDLFYTDASEEATEKYAKALKIEFIRKTNLEEIVTEDPTMVVIRDTEDEVARMTAILKENLGNRVYMANSKPFFIDINNPLVSKGMALQKLCERLGIKKEKVIAIGDGWNDLQMFRAAGIGAAVANAPPKLKGYCDYICENSTYKGVMEVIEKYIL